VAARLLGCTVILAGVIVGGPPRGARAQSNEQALQFSGSASAVGLNINLNITGFPATDVPVDSGGPTAQALADSSGFQSTAYAAFPDPGEFLLTVPGLVPGLVESGVAGLPPIEFPSLPDYPFYVRTDTSNPNASLGSGPYSLSAESKAVSSRADAAAGVRQSLVGNLAVVRASATVGPTEDETVVSEAVSVLEGLRVGPVAIGSIRSIARQSLDQFGEVTTDTELVISGLSIGGIAVNLTENGIDLASTGSVVPLPLNDTLVDLLDATGLTVELLRAEEMEDRVVAPGVRMTIPFSTPVIPQVGQYSGTATITIGQATASLLAGAPGAPDGFSFLPPEPAGTGSSDIGLPDLGGAGGSVTPPIPAPGAGPASAPSPSAPSDGGADPGFQPAAAIRPEALLGIESVYLMIVAGALLAAASGNLIQRLGGRAA
jgi:hypothetical protein